MTYAETAGEAVKKVAVATIALAVGTVLVKNSEAICDTVGYWVDDLLSDFNGN